MSDVAKLAAPSAANFPLQLAKPPSLLRLGPAELKIEDATGLCPPLGLHGYHLQHGHRYTLQIRSQPPDEGGDATQAVVEAGSALLPLLLLPGGHGSLPAKLTVTFRPRYGRIFPTRSELTVTLTTGGVSALCLLVPIVIWPSFGRQCLWAVGVIIAIVGGRYLSMVQSQGADPFSCLFKLTTDYVFLSAVIGVVLLLLLGLKAAGLVWLLWGGPTD